MTPDWNNVAAAGDLTPEALASEAAELRFDLAGDKLVRALSAAIEALEGITV